MAWPLSSNPPSRLELNGRWNIGTLKRILSTLGLLTDHNALKNLAKVENYNPTKLRFQVLMMQKEIQDHCPHSKLFPRFRASYF